MLIIVCASKCSAFAVYCCWLDTNQAQLSCAAIRSLSWPIKMPCCLRWSGVGSKSQHFLLWELFLESTGEKKKDQKNACDITFPTRMKSGGGGVGILMCKRGTGSKAEKMERKKQRWEKESKRERQSHLVWLISGRIIWLAGGKLLYQSPKGRSDFLNHFNKLEECDCPDSAAVSVLIRHSALSELATHEPTKHITINGLLSACKL